MKPLPSPVTTQGARRRRAQQGFGLVELMVALVLGLILIGGTLSIFLSNQQAFRSNEGLARVQENARIAFELMAREIREAGGNPCGAQLVGNVVNNADTTWSLNWDGGSVIGASGTQTITTVVTGTATANRVTATDAIQVLSASLGPSIRVVSSVTATAAINVTTSTHNIGTNDFVLVCDGTSAGIAQVTSVDGTAIHHVSGGTTTPGNCSQGLGYPTDCSSSTGKSKLFQAGGYVSELTAGVWYVGYNGRGGTSLYRLSPVGADEIAEGVTDMQIDYLLRSTSTGNLDSDWVDAASVPAWTPGEDKQVVAVRLNLTLASTAAVGTDQQPLRRQLIHVVNLRNRSL